MGTLFKRADRGGKSGKWYAMYFDVTGERIKRSTGTRDKRTAEQLLAVGTRCHKTKSWIGRSKCRSNQRAAVSTIDRSFERIRRQSSIIRYK